MCHRAESQKTMKRAASSSPMRNSGSDDDFQFFDDQDLFVESPAIQPACRCPTVSLLSYTESSESEDEDEETELEVEDFKRSHGMLPTYAHPLGELMIKKTIKLGNPAFFDTYSLIQAEASKFKHWIPQEDDVFNLFGGSWTTRYVLSIVARTLFELLLLADDCLADRNYLAFYAPGEKNKKALLLWFLWLKEPQFLELQGLYAGCRVNLSRFQALFNKFRFISEVSTQFKSWFTQ